MGVEFPLSGPRVRTRLSTHLQSERHAWRTSSPLAAPGGSGEASGGGRFAASLAGSCARCPWGCINGNAAWRHRRPHASHLLGRSRDHATRRRPLPHHLPPEPGLADQLSRAAISVPLNIAEATGVIGRNKRVRFGTALGSAREVRSCLEIAVVCGFAEPLDARSEDRLDKVIATLFKLAR
ncbi:MAG: four helix bundle protein [Deltaproteobacteria bacterium]|nr:four helix bundle protein [Deltaproteobacteria bacterium]